MMLRYTLLFMFGCLTYLSAAYAGDLPTNPWNINIQTPAEADNTATTKQSEQTKSIQLPNNPWQKTSSISNNTSSEQMIIHKKHSNRSNVASLNNTYQTQTINRNVGGVGRMGYTHTSLKDQANENNSDTSSALDDLWNTNNQPTQTIPEAPTFEPLDTEVDFGYDKFKRKCINRWHQFTTPITNTTQKWWNAIKQTGADLLNW